MSDETDNTYMIDLDIKMQWVGPELPDEEHVLIPIKRFIGKIVRTYSKRAKLVSMKTNIYEIGFEEEELFQDD